MKQYFEYNDEKSSKFWEIDVLGKKTIVRYGKIDTQGQTQEKKFETEEIAQKEADKLIKEKTKKGYVFTGSSEKSNKKAIQFKDFNFKLAVIQELMYNQKILKPVFDVWEFAEKYKKRKIDIDEEGYEIIPEVLEYFKNIEIMPEMAKKVEHISMDGGDDIYLNIIPFWDGEDDVFDIKSADDVAHFPKLKKIDLLNANIVEEFKNKGIKAKWFGFNDEESIAKTIQQSKDKIEANLFNISISKAGVFKKPKNDDFEPSEMKFIDESGNVNAAKNVYFGVIVRVENFTEEDIEVFYELKYPPMTDPSNTETSTESNDILIFEPGITFVSQYYYFLDDWEMVEGTWIFSFTGLEDKKAEQRFEVTKNASQAKDSKNVKKNKTKETDDLKNFDFNGFWEESEYATKNYVCEAPTPEIIKTIENELGYKLPQSYIKFMQIQNGGIPLKNVFYPEDEEDEGIYIHGFFGIGNDKPYSLGSERGSRFWINEWEYPDHGIYICDCPSGGHDMILLDYGKCGKTGEPEVVHIDQEGDYEKTFIAEDFASFVRGLREEIDNSEEMKVYYEKKVLEGKFSKLLASLCKKFKEMPEIEKHIRNIAFKILQEKTNFSMHDDELSYLMYDVQYLLFTHANKIKDNKEYIAKYEKIIAMDGEFSTNGYAPNFITDWLKIRIDNKEIIQMDGFYQFENTYKEKMINQIQQFN